MTQWTQQEQRDGTITVIPAEESYSDRYEREDMTDAERKAVDFLEDMNHKADGTGTLYIHRVSGGYNGNHEFCGEIPLDKYDFYSLQKYIKDNYGGGDYRLMARMKGKKGNAGNTLVSIAGDPKSTTAMVPYGHQSGGDTNMAILQAIQQQGEQNRELMRDMMTRDNEGVLGKIADTIKNMDGNQLTAIATVLTPVVSNLFNKKDSTKELKDMLVLTGQIKDLREDDQGREQGLMGLAQNFLQAFNGAQQNDAQRRGQGTAPAPAPQPGGEPAQQPEPRRDYSHMMQAFQPMIRQLLEAARNDADPDEAALTVLNSVPDQAREQFMGFVRSDDCLPEMGRYEPAIWHRGNALWFAELREALIERYDAGDYGEPANGSGVDVSEADPGQYDPEKYGESEPDQQPGGDHGDVDPDGETDQTGED